MSEDNLTGIVFGYGKKGNPLTKPKTGKIVVLTGYNFDTKPKIGARVEYVISKENKSFDYARIVIHDTRKKVSVSDPLERILQDIQELWDDKFVMHMSPEATKAFPQNLQTLKDKYCSKDYDGAAAIANEHYQWALFESDMCELSPIGFNYATMFQYFKSLEGVIRTTKL